MPNARVRETLGHVAAAYGSLARSRSQTAFALAVLAGVSTTSLGAALACGAAGSLLLATRPLARRPVLGAVAGRTADGPLFSVSRDVDGNPIVLDAAGVRGGLMVAGGSTAERGATLLGLAEEAVSHASGFILFDGSQDSAREAAVWDIARRYGREDDVLVLDMAWDVVPPGTAPAVLRIQRMAGNRFAPLAGAVPDRVVQVVVDLMDETSADGAMWKGRSVAMFTGVAAMLCWLRDAKGHPLDFGTLNDATNLSTIMAWTDGRTHPDMPEGIRTKVRSYLQSLPGYNPDRGARQAQTTLDQHGYLQMQFTKILTVLDQLLGPDPQGSEIDLHDVVRGRRILLVRYAPQYGEHYGCRLVLAALKHVLAEDRAVRGVSPATRRGIPFLVMQDDAEACMVPGLADLAVRPGALDVAMVYAARSTAGMRKLDEREAASIIANTNTRIFMRTEEMSEMPEMWRLNEREAASIIASTNTKIFMRTEDMDFEHAGPGVEGVLAPRAAVGTMWRERNRFLDLAVA